MVRRVPGDARRLFVRYLDPWSVNSQNALLASAVGGIGLVSEVPVPVIRIETSAPATVTTSFCIIEHASR